MSGEEEKETETPATSGGFELPDWLNSRAIKAIDQLLGGFLEIPAAQMKGMAKKIEAKHDRDIKFDDAMNDYAISRAKEHGAFIGRALAAHEVRIARFQLNREKIARQSVGYIEKSPEGELDKIVDVDWLEIFGSRAEKVSNEHIQQIWAKVFAGEINSPGSFSLSTLMLLSNLSKPDAELIAKYSANVLHDGLVDVIENEQGYFKEDLIRLDELGILSNARSQVYYMEEIQDNEWLGLVSEGELGKAFLSVAAKTKYIGVHKGKRKIQYPHVPLTREGRELLSILPAPSIESYVSAFKNLDPNPFDKVEVYEIEARNPDGSIEYSDNLKREI